MRMLKTAMKGKVLVAQSCLPVCRQGGASVHGILQARILERFPSPGNLPNPGIEPSSLALQAESLLSYQF